jgi:hypothetical protein
LPVIVEDVCDPPPDGVGRPPSVESGAALFLVPEAIRVRGSASRRRGVDLPLPSVRQNDYAGGVLGLEQPPLRLVVGDDERTRPTADFLFAGRSGRAVSS